MLTIREPISLHIQRPIQKIQQDLSERMQANYGLMSLPIRREELLHITSEPPEVYFGESNTFQIFNDIKTEDQQELRLDVINNVINRILVAQTDNFTYQDTVYISSILRRLGIRDEKLFMKQVFQLQQEHKETTALLQQYEQHQELLFSLFQQGRDAQQTVGGQTEASAVPMQRYYLHDKIFKRLETGKIYQDLRAYTKGVRHESQQIFRNEYSVGEQAAMAKQFHLHSLKQKLFHMDAPLLYFHQNQYEFLQERLEELSQTTEERISAAVLLNLIDQSYALRQQQIEENSHNWYSLAGALFQTAENTWKRFEANLLERKHISEQMLQAWENVQSIKQQESDMIQQIAEEYNTLQQEFAYTAQQTELTQPRYLYEGEREKITLSGGTFHLTREELQLEYLQDGIEEEDPEAPANVTVEQIQQQLQQIQQKNYENYQKLMQIEAKQPVMKDRRGDRRKAQKDALRALENPAEVMQEFFAAEVRDTVQETNREMYEKLYELFSEETKEVYRQFLQQHPAQANTFLQEIMRQPIESIQEEKYVERIHTLMQEAQQDSETVWREQLLEKTRETYQQLLEQESRQETTLLEEVWKQTDTVYLQETDRERIYAALAEREYELEQQLYEQFSDRTKELYHQFQKETHTRETVFLEHILQESGDAQAQQEVTYLLEQLEQPLHYHVRQEYWMQEETDRVLYEMLRETEQELEHAVYERFSDRAREVYAQFREETTRQEESFLEYVLHRPVQPALREEVLLILEEMTQQQFTERMGTKAAYHIEQRKILQQPVINEHLRQQMQFLQELQTAPVYQQWTQQETLHVQINETAEEAVQQIQREQEQILERQERVLHTQTETISETIRGAAERTFPQMHEAEQQEEIVLSAAEYTRIAQQEQQFIELQQTIEKQIRRQEQEKRTELAEQQREQRFRRIDFVHKKEEQLLDEEMLETIRNQQQLTRREEHAQEQVLHREQTTQTVVQNAMHNVQLQQTENIDELVQQKVRKQLNQLSDQIYGKIEKKLATERKRRGY